MRHSATERRKKTADGEDVDMEDATSISSNSSSEVSDFSDDDEAEIPPPDKDVYNLFSPELFQVPRKSQWIWKCPVAAEDQPGPEDPTTYGCGMLHYDVQNTVILPPTKPCPWSIWFHMWDEQELLDAGISAEQARYLSRADLPERTGKTLNTDPLIEEAFQIVVSRHFRQHLESRGICLVEIKPKVSLAHLVRYDHYILISPSTAMDREMDQPRSACAI